MDFVMRSLMVEDESIVWEMLRYAAHESSIESVRQQPYLARYALDWGTIVFDRIIQLCGCMSGQDLFRFQGAKL